MKLSIVYWVIVFPLVFVSAQTSSTYQIDTFPIPPHTDSVTVLLTKTMIVASSIKVRRDSINLDAFTFHRLSNTIKIYIDSTTDRSSTIGVSYSYLPFNLKPTYSLRTLLFKSDSLDTKKQRAVVTESEGVFTNMFGPELSKSGSISRGFLVGSNRDLTLSSGFRLQMAGKLSNEIDIIAALTDENTPIQPQGNTQTLQEIDNIFVEIKSPTYTATLGDFLFQSSKGEFVNIHRKLQGAKLLAEYRSITPQTELQVTGATSRGKYHSNQFTGIEGVQGPYRLNGKNNERAIIIISGSEKVYVDGEAMLRGENNDYSIDYGSAELTFSTRKLITSASRIVVDFEYSDRQFTRNFAGADVTTTLSNDITIRANYFREGDDPDAPIDVSLNESDLAILRNAGNTTATKSGAVLVGTDSLGIGKGNYSVIDTVINGSAVQFYLFEQKSVKSIFNVAFSPVGQGKGAYVRDGVGRYRFVGTNRGPYDPVVLIATPQLHQLYSFQTTVNPISDLSVDGEYAASNYDQNRLSSIGDNINTGSALKLSARYQPKDITLGGMSIGNMDVWLYERYKEKRFLSLDRIDAVEFGRKWSTDSIATGDTADEEIREGKISFQPVESVLISSGFGSLEQRNQFSSERYDGLLEIKYSNYPLISYYVEDISGNAKQQRLSNEWTRQRGRTEYFFAGITPSFRFEKERRMVKNDVTDSLESSSYEYQLFSPKIGAANVYGLDASSEIEWRYDKAIEKGKIIPQSNSFTHSYLLAIHEIHNFTASSIVTFREKIFEKAFQNTNINQQTTLIKLQTRYRPYSQGLDIDLLYDVATQRTAKLERIFYPVRKGEGQYIWFDANGNGIVDLDDEREFRPDRYDGEYIPLTLNSDNLIPIINLKASSRIRVHPSRFIKNPKSSLEHLLTIVSTETYFRLEERSTEPDIKKIYLLDVSNFLNPVTTQRGYQYFQQDLFLFEYHPEYSFRFRFNQRNGMSQFSSGLEKNYSRERSIRSRFKISNELANQTDVILKNDNAVSSSVINPSRHIENISLATDLSYRLETNIEIGLKVETSQAEDQGGSTAVIADFNGQTMRIVYGFIGNGQIRTEISREEVLIGNQPIGYSLPYELTSGRDFGKNYLWTLSSEYRMAGNLQFSLQYTGRTTSRLTVVHSGRMEVRAFF